MPEKAPTRSVTCEQAIEVLSDYVDGSMDGDTFTAFEAHFSDCPPCVDFLRTFKATISISAKVADAELPDEVRVRLRTFLRTRCQGVKPGSSGD